MTYFPNKIYLDALDLKQLSKFTDLEDLNQASLERIEEIQNMSITGFSEADVREEIVNPILRLLGYTAAHPMFNVTRERNLRFGDIFNFPDYRLLLWQKNFWVLEAKKPIQRNTFSGKDVLQAFKYGAHPDIKAGLVALCDGRKFSVFDIDENLKEPILHFKISQLSENFDSLRLLLAPWNIWFFEKRRALRNVANIFASEVNYGRAEEFMANVGQTLQSLRPQIMANFRELNSDDDRATWIRNQDANMIIGNVFYEPGNMSSYYASSERLAKLYLDGDFSIPQKLFPSRPKRINEHFLSRTLHFLCLLKRKTDWDLNKLPGFNYLPPSLRKVTKNKTDLDSIIQGWAYLCVTNFKDWPMIHLILNVSYTANRLATLMAISNPTFSEVAKQDHISKRFYFGELEPIQKYASHTASLTQLISNMADSVTVAFVKEYTLSSKDKFVRTAAKKEMFETHFKKESAHVGIKAMWAVENELLDNLDGRYDKLIAEKNLTKIGWAVKNIGVKFDELANIALWFSQDFEELQTYWKENHMVELEFLTKTHSNSAKKLLGISESASINNDIDDDVYAKYFFLEETNAWQAIVTEYNR